MLKFKDEQGHEFPAWEKKRLGEAFKERSQRAIGNEEILSVTIEKGVIKQSDIDRKFNIPDNRTNYKVVKVRDIAYNSMRMWQGAEGDSVFNGIVSPAYTVITPHKNMESSFFAYMFKTQKSINLFTRYSQGLTSDTWNLKYPLFSSISMNIPSGTA